MKIIKILSIALLPLLVTFILEAAITVLLLSLTNLMPQQVAFASHIGRIVVVVYLIVILRKKGSININLFKDNSFNIAFIFWCVAYSLISIAIGHLWTEGEPQYLVAREFGILRIISALFIATWSEEVLFRAWLLDYLRKKGINVMLALFINALLFAFWHYNAMYIDIWRVLLLHFFSGLFLGFIFLYTNNILYSIAAHFLINLTYFFISILNLPIAYAYPILAVSGIYFLFFVYKIIKGPNRSVSP
ncbi:CAAX protease self-immunity [Saccharicrinis carchari]|uniref:CAAX protease self-immunity n=1 Tax=Saccharicrinis carchari TaxID=1168039 RepID=A0A521DGP4_SACCC|nr:type II CAAX endopeptidase family protein [Saccharicrinis carchari]SMO70798.1 CAAX protease self-immunity [Saccharicrinis carchari]